MNSFANDFRYVWNGPNRTLFRIIIVNIAVWVAVNVVNLFVPRAPIALLAEYLMLPSGFLDALMQPWGFVTTFFTHQALGHLFWNMVILYWFGEICNSLMGSRKMLGLYLLGGLAGGLAYLAMANLFPYFGANAGAGALGASAAVNAVLLGTATIAPDYRMHLLFLGPVKIKYIALVVVLLSVFGLRGPNVGGEVAHLGGALIGYLYVMNLRRGVDMGRWLLSGLDWAERLFAKRERPVRVKVSYRRQEHEQPRQAPGAAMPAQDVVDAILDKISAKGYKSLSDEEKQVLFRASQKKD
jgi:membrane associated rhomboid family serine protease